MSVSKTYPKGSYVWVSKCIKIIDKEHVYFTIQEDYKVLNTGKWIEVGKVKYNRRNFFSIKITEDSIEQEQLVNDSIWKIEIRKRKKSQKYIKDFIIIANFIL